MANVVEEYWSGVARRLQEEADTFNRLISHDAEKGRENELSLIRLLSNLLPSTFGIGGGIIIDSTGKYSRQTDVVIYDSVNQPRMMAQTNQVIFPVENVLLTVEVKTTLTEEELQDCIKKRNSLHTLSPASDRPIPPLLVFAYHAEGTPPTVAKHLFLHQESERPEMICVIDPGILAGDRRLFDSDSVEGYAVGVVGLHDLSPDGSRISGSWQTPRSDDQPPYVLRNGLRFPMTRLGMKAEHRIIGEPGRALLLFCTAVMNLLSQSSSLPPPVLRHYLQKPAQEMAEITPAATKTPQD